MNKKAVPVIGITGPLHHSYKSGKIKNQDGYVRLKAGPHRDKYEHRVVMEVCINDGVSFPPGFTRGGGIPQGFEIHHFDADRTHNCIGNLMVLQDCIHHAVEASKRSFFTKHKRKNKS